MDIFHFILGPIRGVLVWFDSVVYGFIPELYKIMLYLADVDLVSNNVPVQALIQRIYILVGVFMLFKLSFSIMNYIVNPDAFTDQSKGFTNLVKRVMIAVVLLVSIPWIFTKLYDIQGEILTSNILARFILGESTPVKNKKNKGTGNTDLEKSIETSAKDVQFLLFGPFYSLNYDTDEFRNVCKPDQAKPSRHIIGSVDMGSSKDCLDKVASLMDNDPSIVASDVNISDFFRYEGDNDDKRDFSQFTDLASWTLSNGEFAINYNPIISTLCGGYLVFLLLSFCIDIAGRIFRLLFLQILSPIAVISSIDPTSSGDRLKDWGTECLKVWASLYLRMGVFFLIIQLVRVITNTIYAGNSFITTSSYSGNSIPVWLYIFLILGIFNAVGKIPELIEKATGLKMSGELQLNPFKALSGNAGFMAMSGAALGTVGGALSGGLSGYTTARNNKHGIGRSLLSGAGAVASGGVTGLARGGRSGGTKGWDSGLQSGGRIARRMDVREATGGILGLRGMAIDRARDAIGAPTTFESMENKAKRFDEVSENIDKMKNRAVDQLSKKSDEWKAAEASKIAAEEDLRNGRINNQQYVDALNAAYSEEQRLIAKYINDSAKAPAGKQDAQLELLRKSLKKSVKDSGLMEIDKTGKSTGKKLSVDESTSWEDIGADKVNIIKSSAEASALGIRSSNSYNDARDRDQAIHSTRLDAHQKR